MRTNRKPDVRKVLSSFEKCGLAKIPPFLSQYRIHSEEETTVLLHKIEFEDDLMSSVNKITEGELRRYKEAISSTLGTARDLI